MKKKLILSGILALLAVFIIVSCNNDADITSTMSAPKVKDVTAEKVEYSTGATGTTYQYVIVKWTAAESKKGNVGYSIWAQQEGKKTLDIVSGYYGGYAQNEYTYDANGQYTNTATSPATYYYNADPDAWSFRATIDYWNSGATRPIPSVNDYYYGKKVRFGVRTTDNKQISDPSDIVWAKEYIQF